MTVVVFQTNIGALYRLCATLICFSTCTITTEVDGEQVETADERLGSGAITVSHSWGDVKYDAGNEFVRAHAYDSHLLRVVCASG